MSSPVRVQIKRTKGFKMPENTVYVGRGTVHRNPFVRGKKMTYPLYTCLNNLDKTLYGSNQIIKDDLEALRLYETTFWEFYLPELGGNELLTQLKGKNLACSCPINAPCHADYLLNIVNEE